MPGVKDGRKTGFLWIDNRVYPILVRLRESAVKVYLCIACRTSGRGRSAYVSYSRMATELNLDRRTVIAAVRQLISAQLLRREPRTFRGLKAANQYVLLDPPAPTDGGEQETAVPAGAAVGTPGASTPVGAPGVPTQGAPNAPTQGAPNAPGYQDPSIQNPSKHSSNNEADDAGELQRPDAAAAVASGVDEAETNAVKALGRLGMGADLAARYARQDASLALEVAAYVEDLHSDAARKPIRNPVGFVVRALQDPVVVGFSRGPGGGWLRPPSEGPSARRPNVAQGVDPALTKYRSRTEARKAAAAGSGKGGLP
jgi:hypothetical protein